MKVNSQVMQIGKQIDTVTWHLQEALQYMVYYPVSVSEFQIQAVNRRCQVQMQIVTEDAKSR